jgi:hypothetical protein
MPFQLKTAAKGSELALRSGPVLNLPDRIEQ